jgi:methyl-accepting chemotaxis protein
MSSTAEPVGDALKPTYLRGDSLMVMALAIYAVGAVVVGFRFDQPAFTWVTALIWTVLLSLPGLIGYVVVRGTLASRLLLAFSLSALVALHIHTSMGMIEFHFGVFVTLALLLVYLDWRPIVFGAGLFAVHHVVFDRLQAMGFGLYCLSEANFGVILLHAFYVVVQTAMQVFLVLGLSRSVRDNAEVALLAQGLRQGDRIALQTQWTVAAPVARALQDNLGLISSAVSMVRSAATHVQGVTAEIASGNRDLSQRTEQTASSLEQTAASMVELTSGIRHTAEAAQQARQLVAHAADMAHQGGEVVDHVTQTMGQIHQSSERIRDIIGVIDGIAFQTNILALNASVEAARAGEQGRGFAVVASEVRTLAQRSAQAAKEIKELINASVGRVQEGNEQARRAAQTMRGIVEGVQRVHDLIAEISAASREQSEGMAQVNTAVSHLDNVTQQNAALVEQSTAAAEQLREQADRLVQAVSVFVESGGATQRHEPLLRLNG